MVIRPWCALNSTPPGRAVSRRASCPSGRERRSRFVVALAILVPAERRLGIVRTAQGAIDVASIRIWLREPVA